MRAGHVMHCSRALNNTPSGERVGNAAVSRDDPAGSVIRDQSGVRTLPEVHHVIHPPKTLPCSPYIEAPALLSQQLIRPEQCLRYNGRGYLSDL